MAKCKVLNANCFLFDSPHEGKETQQAGCKPDVSFPNTGGVGVSTHTLGMLLRLCKEPGIPRRCSQVCHRLQRSETP